MLDLLSGLRVVSFNHFLLGPMGIQALADLGADVIAVESTDGAWQRHWAGGDIWPDGHSALFLRRQPQQAQRRPRPEVGEGPRDRAEARRQRRRGGRELPARA